MRARIYKPARTATQSGTARTHRWLLEVEPAEARELDPLMGWVGSGDTPAQVRLRFRTREEAEAYARSHGYEVDVLPAHERAPTIRPMGYGDNFAHARRMPWTH